MNTASRSVLILIGVLVGMWLAREGYAPSQPTVALLAVLALLLTIATSGSPHRSDERTRSDESFRLWLDVWSRQRDAPGPPHIAPREEMAAVSCLLVLCASDRVLKSVLAAGREEYSPASVANVMLEMRRSLGRPSLTLRAADLEAFLAPLAATGNRPARARVPQPTDTVSFIS